MKNKKTLRIAALIAALLTAIFMLASCTAADGDYPIEDSIEILPGESGSGSDIPSYEDKGDMADGNTNNNTNTEYTPKIIRTATLSAETQDFRTAVAEIEKNVSELGGYIENCNIQNLNESYYGEAVSNRHASYVLRIPADKLDAFLAKAGELLNVTSSITSAEDISGEYYDMQARISVLETERALVEKMLSEATNINTMIDLEKRLYDIIYEIESYKTAIKVYDSKVAYSTVELQIYEVEKMSPTENELGFTTRLRTVAAEAWQDTVEICQELVLGLVSMLPALVVLAIPVLPVVLVLGALLIIVLVVVLVVRKRIRKMKAAQNKA